MLAIQKKDSHSQSLKAGGLQVKRGLFVVHSGIVVADFGELGCNISFDKRVIGAFDLG
jgi:hypothetical protein